MSADQVTPVPGLARAPSRVAVVRVPDWPVVVARASGALPAPPPIGVPGAIVRNHRIVACDPAAREAGVRVGQRVRDAQGLVPSIALADDDPVGEVLAFERVVRATLEVVPTVQSLGDGALAFRLRGPARFYGGEAAAIAVVRDRLAGLGLELRAGGADDRFGAELAARGANGPEPLLVPAGRSAEFLAPLPVSVLGNEHELPDMLHRLGVHTLGDFAQLTDAHVRERFGALGLRDLVRARGRDDRGVEPDRVGEERELRMEFEPGIEGVEELALAMREPLERFIRGLALERLVCREIRIVLRAELGGVSDRLWRQRGFFSARDLIDRMKWQLTESGLESALVEVQALPEQLDRDTEHMPGLWGGGQIDDRTKHALERLQGMLGRDAVLTASTGGGRLLAERSVLTPWGDAPPEDRSGPWPGALPSPRPATVYRPPLPAKLVDERGESVDAQGLERRTAGAPATFWPPYEDRRRVVAWAGPWPLRRRGLGGDGHASASLHRLQVLDGEGEAWVLLHDGGWFAEGRYD